MLLFSFWFFAKSVFVIAYSNPFYTIANFNNSYPYDVECVYQKQLKSNLSILNNIQDISNTWYPEPVVRNNAIEEDPYLKYQRTKYQLLFGTNTELEIINREDNVKLNYLTENSTARFLHFPTGTFLRKAELFQDKIGVHLPPAALMHRGYCLLKVTRDYMQTAVDAFAILMEGTLQDIKRLPADYVLRSARTISMMKLTREKFVAIWDVVKGQTRTNMVTYETLEQFRPLFKYLNGREMSRLDLSNDRILTYIGTHPDLDRHQVGVVASVYIKMNPYWSEPRYLNMMNNLLCGVPMTFMRKLSENTYLQLSHQVFYHIRACDPLQRRFYLAMMTRTQVLGKAYSWNAQEVSRLGLLLAEVEGPDLSSIKPEALSGITAQVMLKMQPQNLQYLTEEQLRYIGAKSINIMARKLKAYQDLSPTSSTTPVLIIVCTLSRLIIIIIGMYSLK